MFRHLILMPILFASYARAQNAADEQKRLTIQMDGATALPSVGITAAFAGAVSITAGAPYSADTTTQRIQNLADGNRIEENTSGSVARDNQGRVRREESLPLGPSSADEAPHIIMIDDPVAQVHWTLDANTKTAIKMPFGTNMTIRAPLSAATRDKAFFEMAGAPTMAGSAIAMVVPDGKTLTVAGAPNTNETKTDLGTQAIEGVPARGTRLTRTIPAGQIGNVQPIVITTETWYSPDLKVLILSKSNDPRIGDTVYKLANIQRSEPSPTLFQPPDDYTIKNQAEVHVKNP